MINMSSTLALNAVPGRDCYTAAKGAIASMTRSMAVEYAPQKIRVNAIAPSVTLSDRVKKLLEGSKDIARLGSQHLHGLGLPIHMANMAVYLASDEAAITTGQIMVVDSGATIGSRGSGQAPRGYLIVRAETGPRLKGAHLGRRP